MKKIHFFLSTMAAVCAMMMSSSCNPDAWKLEVDKSLGNKTESRTDANANAKGVPVKVDTTERELFNDYIDEEYWYIKVGRFVGEDIVDSLDKKVYVGPIVYKVYDKETMEVAEIGFHHLKFYPNGSEGEDGDFDAKGLKKVTKFYGHNFNEIQGLVLSASYNMARTTLYGKEYKSPDREVNISYTGETDKTIIPEYEKDDKTFNYYEAKFPYELSARSLSKPKTFYGYLGQKVRKDDEFVRLDEGDEDYEYTKYDENGNPIQVRSWKKVRPVYSVSGEHDWETIECYFNYTYTQPRYATEYMANFDVTKINWTETDKTDGTTRQERSGNATINIVKYSFTGNTGFNGTAADNKAKEYAKQFGFTGERGTATIYGKTVKMPVPEYTSFSVIGFGNNSLSDTDGYQRKLNTINVGGKLGTKSVNLKAETELRVKKDDEPETFHEEAQLVGLRSLNETTSYSRLVVRRYSSKGGYTESQEGINLRHYGNPEEEIKKIVSSFSNPEDWKVIDWGEDAKSGEAYPNGLFMVQPYERVVTIKDMKNNVVKHVTLIDERADRKLENNGSIKMPYVSFFNDTFDGVVITGLTRTNADNVEYQQQRYAATVSFTEKAVNPSGIDDFRNEFVATPTSFTTSAVLMVAKEQERETPSWLGNPVDARYTRVQKSAGANFEDMLAFKYEHGVVLVPNGDKSKMLVFAFSQSDATKYGVGIAAETQWYSAAWKNGAWIPAMIRDNANREDKAIDDDSKLKSWTYKGQGVAHNVDKANALEKGIGYECTPVPHRQSVKKEGNKMTLRYYKNNKEASSFQGDFVLR